MADSEFANPLDVIADMRQKEEAARPAKPSRPGAFANPMEVVAPADRARAVKSSLRAGQYERKTVAIAPEQRQYIEETVAPALGLSGLATYRWLLDQGLQLFEQGVRPEIEEVVTRSVPTLKHWTSQ